MVGVRISTGKRPYGSQNVQTYPKAHPAL